MNVCIDFLNSLFTLYCLNFIFLENLLCCFIDDLLLDNAQYGKKILILFIFL